MVNVSELELLRPNHRHGEWSGSRTLEQSDALPDYGLEYSIELGQSDHLALIVMRRREWELFHQSVNMDVGIDKEGNITNLQAMTYFHYNSDGSYYVIRYSQSPHEPTKAVFTEVGCYQIVTQTNHHRVWGDSVSSTVKTITKPHQEPSEKELDALKEIPRTIDWMQTLLMYDSGIHPDGSPITSTDLIRQPLIPAA